MAAYVEKIYRFAGGNQEMKLRLERLVKGINLCLELFSQQLKNKYLSFSRFLHTCHSL